MSKIQTKMLCVYLHVLRAHEVVLIQKMSFYVAYVKNDKNQ
jgi:hypothetical protein